MALLLNAGDTVQRSYSYTKPSPNHISTPQECGDRTGNLAPPLTQWVNGYINGTTGDISEQTAQNFEKTSDFIRIEPNSTYAFSHENGVFPSGYNGAWRAIGLYNENKQFINRVGGIGDSSIGVMTTAETVYIRLTFRTYGGSGNAMLNTSSTSKPYEPFGVKIPLSLSPTPIYLPEPLRRIGEYADEVSSDGTVTRRIKKLVLTWSENWEINNRILFRIALSDSAIRYEQLFSTHFVSKQSFEDVYNTDNSVAAPATSLYVNCTDYAENLDGWKAYLSAQYAAGTPVCVWYVLAKPTTEQITAPTLTTAKGSNTLTVDTTLQPSSVSITGNIKAT